MHSLHFDVTIIMCVRVEQQCTAVHCHTSLPSALISGSTNFFLVLPAWYWCVASLGCCNIYPACCCGRVFAVAFINKNRTEKMLKIGWFYVWFRAKPLLHFTALIVLLPYYASVVILWGEKNTLFSLMTR